MKRITLSALLMTLFLLLSCGSGSANVEDPKSKFLNVFTSFGDMVTNAFGIKADTTKSEVGKYFAAIEKTMISVKKELQDAVAKNENYSKVKSLVDTLTGKLKKIAEGAKTAGEAIGSDSNDPIANVAAHDAAAGVAGTGVNNLVKGIKDIVDVVLDGKGDAEAGDDKKAEDGSTARTAADGAGKLFASDNAGAADSAKKSAADAAKAVGAVTGADILKAMVKNGASAAANAAKANAKDATIAGAIALRAMAKGGKFAGPSAADQGAVAPIVKGAAVSAVTKALNTLTIAIRNTIDSGLKSINDELAKGTITP
ncbi:variable large protein (plasmid) [Candidatus Borrelia fainii]|uniref:Variable large protein n=1 Tax=Candidatus Borrelia fainii TaxID=2518322 RepID=A0ABM8DLF4_9SPIR|nr:variable large family protein [Candidatus Borrelia fainii]BDU63424.1 variable large protein [Candidatus Borrelia fainii]BDU63502.1 variable large protein [Candidatus Borrelia fainii]